MKIGIIKETKTPEDNRVALTPNQIKELKEKFPESNFIVQPSDIRAYSDQEYADAGIELKEDLSECDLLFGIKEAIPSTLIPNKHYIFFGHIAKRQPYNIPLFKELLRKKITFSDYEYFVDENGIRLVAFGWYAGVVGTYYTLTAWGKKTKKYELPKPTRHFTIADIKKNILNAGIGGVKMVITGSGRVSHGAQYILDKIGAKKVSPEEFLNIKQPSEIIYCVLDKDMLVAENGTEKYDEDSFMANPQNYHSILTPFLKTGDILLSCHFWEEGQPIYVSESNMLMPDFNIKVIGDITCDIKGSISSTLRASTHSDPFYDYNPKTGKEEPAFNSPDNITVMAVDTCPNALPRETSEYFGEKLIEHVLEEALATNSLNTPVLERATITVNGKLSNQFSNLTDYVETF